MQKEILLKNGCKVTVESWKWSARLIISIPKGVNSIKVRSNRLIIDLKRIKKSDSNEISMKFPYRIDEFGLVKLEKIRLDISNDSFEGKVVISPVMYLSSKRIGKIRKKRDENFVEIHVETPRASSPNFYKYNNVARPYGGGLVRPK